MSFQLSPQLLDMNFQGIRQAVVALVPDVLVNSRPRQHLTRMPKKKDQQSMLLSGQVETVITPFGPVGCQVQAEVLISEQSARRTILPSCRHPDSRQQL